MGRTWHATIYMQERFANMAGTLAGTTQKSLKEMTIKEFPVQRSGLAVKKEKKMIWSNAGSIEASAILGLQIGMAIKDRSSK